ncbi:uncharacterized protein LOC127717416 [Mytilus californianus]|uniref:uncharacterized protein LOC127717416 n=1 Tax=Mytilus californianus TaxID=6549 RepID=UPI00224695D1|nr:uncharacterized protein LOC127717416 [Mytilus californianus]
MLIYFSWLHVVFAIIFHIYIVNPSIIRRRSVGKTKFRPPRKNCLDFCVFTNCNRGHCVLDNRTCYASCVCPANVTGRWCDTEIDNIKNKTRSNILFMPRRHHTTTRLDDRVPKNSSMDQSFEVVTDPNQYNETSEGNATIYNNPENFQSRQTLWNQCRNTCQNGGKCVESYTDSYNYSCSDLNPDCGYGLICERGVCLKTDSALIFSCLCEFGYTGSFCKERCTRDCGVHGSCKIIDKKTGTSKCKCDSDFAGPYCTTKIVARNEDEILYHWYVTGVCVAIGTLLIGMMIILPYCIWKKRRIFVMKILHYFQHYEDDDGKSYDAFISYKSSKTDQDFVLKQLYPKLEMEMGYKLCMHFRDFTPGDVIANNIIRAVEDSRRTIMVISQSYIESEWCRLEYQKAQHEMLKLKHKIIPVILDEISNMKIDKNLKAILNSVTYIEWPGESDSKKLEKFWKQLKLSMPKKQTSSSSEHISSISSSESKSTDISSCSDSISSSYNSHISIQPCDSGSSNDYLSHHQSSKRIRTLLRNPFRLNISSDNFRKLNRACSSDSGISSPATASPSSVSPLINKDLNPLLPRKHVDIRHNNSKGLIQKQHFQNQLNENGNCLNVHQENHFITGSTKIHSIPDVCRTSSERRKKSNGFNIAVSENGNLPTHYGSIHNVNNCQTCILNQEVSNEFLDQIPSKCHTKCTTCILNSDDINENIRQPVSYESGRTAEISTEKVLNTSSFSERTKTL